MVFSKEYIKRFAFSLSVNDKALEFNKRDKLNSIVRSYLDVSRKEYKPRFSDDITKIVVPVYGRSRNYPSLDILPEKSYRDLERDFEDIFFTLFLRIDSAGFLSNEKRKYAREKFLEGCNINNEILTEDAFRKLFDRFRKKKELQIERFLKDPDISILSLYESGTKNFTHQQPENVQLLP